MVPQKRRLAHQLLTNTTEAIQPLVLPWGPAAGCWAISCCRWQLVIRPCADSQPAASAAGDGLVIGQVPRLHPGPRPLWTVPALIAVTTGPSPATPAVTRPASAAAIRSLQCCRTAAAASTVALANNNITAPSALITPMPTVYRQLLLALFAVL